MNPISIPGLIHRTTCRLCESPQVEKVVPIHPIPLADAYLPASRMEDARQLYPVDLYFCHNCAHAQLLDVVDPKLVFGEYLYVTDTSPGLVEHFRQYCQTLMDRFHFAPGGLMVEMGSNSGVLLRLFQERGLKVLGVDPAEDIARQATANGQETWPTFFNLEVARRILAERGKATLVAANNVFAHSDDLSGMAQGVSELLADNGVFSFEVNYLIDLIEKMMFDIIYHEHLSYHSVKPLMTFLGRHGMELIHVQRVTTKGGSIRCLAQKKGGPHAVDPSVHEVLSYEIQQGFDQAETFRRYGPKVDVCRDAVINTLKKFKDQGKRIVGFGAAPATTTLVYHFGLAPYLEAIVDDNPRKHNRFSPGYKIPILPSRTLLESKPDCVVILAWTYAERIMANNHYIKDWGGVFLIPLPELRIV